MARKSTRTARKPKGLSVHIGLNAVSAAHYEGWSGELTACEFDARDMARGRACIEPALGRVAGITPTGELLVALADSVAPFRTGSLILQDAR